MKNIGIVTFFNAVNNGAFLQAYAMQSFLEANGFNASFLRVKEFKPSDNPYSLRYSEELYKCYKSLKIAKDFKNLDAVVYGSDEIWNLRNCGLSPYFWGYKLQAPRKIVYAACTGNSKLLDYCLFPYTICGLRKFDAVSVRDQQSYNKMIHFTRKKLERVLDPTFLISYDKFKSENVKGKYVLVYTYGLSDETIKLIKEYAFNHKYKIICTGSYADWADENIFANPFEWIALIYNAELVFSSTFHGTVFSVICGKQFYVVDTDSEKVIDLLGKLCLLNRKTDSFNDDDVVDYEEVKKILKPLVEASKNFLLTNLD